MKRRHDKYSPFQASPGPVTAVVVRKSSRRELHVRKHSYHFTPPTSHYFPTFPSVFSLTFQFSCFHQECFHKNMYFYEKFLNQVMQEGTVGQDPQNFGIFTKQAPRPIQSSSRNVHVSVDLCICVSVPSYLIANFRVFQFFVFIFLQILNHDQQQNCLICSKVTAVLITKSAPLHLRFC